jgi:DNA-binding NarL/FixJ family response regulator
MNQQESPVRIAIADDHPIFRRGLRTLLEAEPGFTVIGEASDGTEVLELVRKVQPDVLLLDLAMPRLSGLEALRELSNSGPHHTLIVILTVAIEKRQIIESLQLGARGIVLKDAAAQLLITALHTVIGGQHWVCREAVTHMVQYLRRLSPPEAARGEQARNLTRREREILSAIVAGLTNREIAEKLTISEDTVKHHLSRIFDKVGVSRRLELAMFAVNHGLIEGN